MSILVIGENIDQQSQDFSHDVSEDDGHNQQCENGVNDLDRIQRSNVSICDGCHHSDAVVHDVAILGWPEESDFQLIESPGFVYPAYVGGVRTVVIIVEDPQTSQIEAYAHIMGIEIAIDNQLNYQIGRTMKDIKLSQPFILQIYPTRSIYLSKPKYLNDINIDILTYQRSDNHDEGRNVYPEFTLQVIFQDLFDVGNQQSFLVIGLDWRHENVDCQDYNEEYLKAEDVVEFVSPKVLLEADDHSDLQKIVYDYYNNQKIPEKQSVVVRPDHYIPVSVKVAYDFEDVGLSIVVGLICEGHDDLGIDVFLLMPRSLDGRGLLTIYWYEIFPEGVSLQLAIIFTNLTMLAIFANHRSHKSINYNQQKAQQQNNNHMHMSILIDSFFNDLFRDDIDYGGQIDIQGLCRGVLIVIIIEFIQKMERQGGERQSLGQCNKFGLENEGAVVKNLQELIYTQIRLELNHPQMNDRLRYNYQQMQAQLKVDLRKIQKAQYEQADNPNKLKTYTHKINQNIQNLLKLKEIAIYMKHLKKDSIQLEKDLQKFRFYKQRESKLEHELQTFLNEPMVLNLFLKEYENSFNGNYFISDLIQFFHFLYENNLMESNEKEVFRASKNCDIELIENGKLIFRQLCEMNDKYTGIENNLNRSYISFSYILKEEEIISQQAIKSLEEQKIEEKYSELKQLASKIQSLNSNHGQMGNSANGSNIIIVAEQQQIFNSLDCKFNYRSKHSTQEFLPFLRQLYEESDMKTFQREDNFNFLRCKIIKSEIKGHLNRILSGYNMVSLIMNKISTITCIKYGSYTFKHPKELIKSEYDQQHTPYYQKTTASKDQAQFVNNTINVIRKQSNYLLKIEQHPIIFPSAINNYNYFTKYLIHLTTIIQHHKLYTPEFILQLISIKANELMEWVLLSFNLYEMIKNKYFKCYELLWDYLNVIFKVKYEEQLQYLDKYLDTNTGESELLAFFMSKFKKAASISQIIFEFDAEYDVYQILKTLEQIQRKHHATFAPLTSHEFYQKVLNEIIQIKNNLKFDRCYSFSNLHQIFGFPNAKPKNIKDLASQLAPLSKDSLKLSQLLKFYAAKTKIKREVFKAELYWISIVQNSVKNKFIITSQKKKISFKDFLQQNCHSILDISEKPLSYFILNIQEFERMIYLFTQQIERLKIIQSILLILKPSFPMQDYISAFSYKELTSIFHYLSQFNLVEQIYGSKSKKQQILDNFTKKMQMNRVKFVDLNIEMALLPLRMDLSNYIFMMYAFEHHYETVDCFGLTHVVMRGGNANKVLKLQILRSKKDIMREYEQCQFMDYNNLYELVSVYSGLLFICINRLIRHRRIQQQDITLLQRILKTLPQYHHYNHLSQLKHNEQIKHNIQIKSKVQTLASIHHILIDYQETKDRYGGTKWNEAISQNIWILSKMNIITRRLFCNELIELKREVGADEWRSCNRTICLSTLKAYLTKEFLSQINIFLQSTNFKYSLNLDRSLQQNISKLDEVIKQEIIHEYSGKYDLSLQKQEIILFDELRGYQIEKIYNNVNPQEIQQTNKRFQNKRGVAFISVNSKQKQNSSDIIAEIQHKLNLQIVKQSLPIRKCIYSLQLQEKRIRDEISWQTCKLEYNVINKINRFIEESNLDQKQSLINFKYTVNLETIKGIQNVINEKTELFSIATNDNSHAFVTQGDEEGEGGRGERVRKEEDKENGKKRDSLLDVNIKNIFNHYKTLKIFWAWKSSHIEATKSNDEWLKFSQNSENILRNTKHILKLKYIQQLNGQHNWNEIMCSIMREQNTMLNKQIKDIKLTNVNKKLTEFKAKHGKQNEKMIELNM